MLVPMPPAARFVGFLLAVLGLLGSSAPSPTAPGPATCTAGSTQACALVPGGCATGFQVCSGPGWGACTFDRPPAPPACVTRCTDGSLEGDNLFTAVDRYAALRADWTPTDLVPVPAAYRTGDATQRFRSEALGHLILMLKAQRQASAPPLFCGSPYRSFEEQCQLFGAYVRADGCTKANTYSAMAGHSEHQLGTACDLVYSGTNLIRGHTAADAWIHGHAYEHGFLVSYPEGSEALTGYEAEPWHVRYLGIKAALLHHQMEQDLGRTMSTHEFVATIACWPPSRLDDLATPATADREAAAQAVREAALSGRKGGPSVTDRSAHP